MDAATGGGLAEEEDAVDVDDVAVDGGTEAEGVARVPRQKLLCASCVGSRYPRTICRPSHTIDDASTRHDGRLYLRKIYL